MSYGSAVFSFASPVKTVAFDDLWYPTTAVTLFSDAAVTQALGTFDTTHAYVYGTIHTFAFQSNTPFQSFKVTVTPAATWWINDLRFSAVPEPGALMVADPGVAASPDARGRLAVMLDEADRITPASSRVAAARSALAAAAGDFDAARRHADEAERRRPTGR